MMGLNERDSIENRAEVSAVKKMIGFSLGVVAFLTATFWYIPKDLFTTATWLDSKQLGLLYSNGATAFAAGSFWDITDITVPVSEEAFRFALLVMLLQFIFMFLAGTSGSFVLGKRVDSPIQFLYLAATGEGVSASTVNWKKLGYIITFIAIGAFDTFTDWQFSSKYGQANAWLALVYSFGVYNLGSEYAFMIGLQFAVGYAPDAIAGALRTAIAIITSPFSGSGGKKSQPQGKPQPPQGQGKPQPPSNNQQRKDKQRNQQQQQRSQPPNGNGRVPFDPRTMPMPTMPPGLRDEE